MDDRSTHDADSDDRNDTPPVRRLEAMISVLQ